MSRENCPPYQENLASYSLGVLDAGEISALESHLATCKDCQADLADYQKIATGLLHSIPPRTPSAGLRRRLMIQLPSARSRPFGPLPRIPIRFSPGQFISAACMLILLGLNIFSMMQIRDLQRQQAGLLERLSTERAALAMLAYPGTQTLEVNADVQNLTGSILVDKEKTTAVLVLQNLPQLEAGQTYQIWLIDANGKRISGGLFISSAGQEYTTVSIQSTDPIRKFVAVGVTVEPLGGSEQPTGRRVLVVSW